ncbi:putative casparian strip membrane protein [Helianthus annuus]|uniref:CASP-like protein n=1 Tax=Helianthus annuus TaxID=4232 RepID=A0A251VB29_HELAN|nr:CASP-like protein 1 [Helianthus annuus]KAJ0593849.1 putative casparian strip membrane protein [Helianthus annuus]KAJ0601874.1 putative casparian strip membrane protein [Helianthus annuus]KAJ0608872.1 putative casparian strip membrane protein [Helianthus annuus]KAJ0768914.1 putative casparian strip membrane protein [Helianthus annuus]KAJ0774660.1 putative casparian strip membrane protein [Helianthus annuus]
MTSNDTTTPPYATTVKPMAPPPENKDSIGPVVDVGLRFLLFATALVAIIVMVTSKQTKLVPFLGISIVAKFTQSPAFVYFVAALSVTCLYSVITGVVSLLVLMKPGGQFTTLQFHFVILDALLLGIVAAATGAAGGVGYIGYKGNSHSQWNKVCDNFGSFCTHFAASIFLSLISSILLLLLVWRSVYVLSKKISRP